ncbi:uncharacterized protein EI97DRAFT_459896 [Westerdykella ornata]|uniref:F-box domain-containing protein n=1 Tax=Westerdykella ornata TaxID=318751 RepID=A0A6A6JH39_WESOR|nr:uncharacterized protein EI97DRAFT_459896 [Westerdykella ornata]KAF2274946.1 hypothetical protein EI97DRAFT_459896 [Westerdykella ornata]
MHYEKCGMCTYPHTLHGRIERIAERAKPDRTRGSPNDQARLLTTKIQPPGNEDEKYKFVPGRCPSFDPVLPAILQVLADLRQTNIAVANGHLRVMQSNDDPPIWPPNATALAIIPRTHPLTPEKIHVRAGYHRRWIPLSDWLRTLGVRIYPHEIEKAQRIWWKVNNKAFPLLKLPAEIRLMIYLHALGGPDIYPVVSVNGNWTQSIDDPTAWQSSRIQPGLGNSHKVLFQDDNNPWRGYCDQLKKEIRTPVWQPNLALLRVNKQVHAEASYAMWELTRKCFINRQMFANVLAAQPGSARNYTWLKRIQLDFTNKQYFEFLGIAIDERTKQMRLDGNTRQCEVLLKSSIPTLQALDIRFRAPDVGFLASPWNQPCCQAVVVDWIMTFAFPWIKHVKEVTVSGVLRITTREKWTEILDSKRTGEATPFNESAEIARILNTPSRNLPPRCLCNRRYECIVGHNDRGGAFNFKIKEWMATQTEFDPYDTPYSEEEAKRREEIYELQRTGGWPDYI